ncbi:glucose-methanol-choline oxidoreductase [Leadbetterella byssophila DSM 17132]|uniref:Glucose-methanol-choline oxidoreductase n=1 Tax=Leadbetterella byssophila (strain DSM 17132 / JCM 16389 / KACC 11308 / NBRC 106382 / 4M15) TaxID=649349 RepID=E4RZ49_LEAB4|nr:GMC family oxidoreductase [Leadbetterella byssophila]ADQ19167.1 glucose-methanol-choline oxidoreductase [Leadbetterella byssophila DSM 17132]
MTYDAIVVGSGLSGGWAAKELCEKGLKVLLIERGREVKHREDYTTAMKEAWQLEHRGKMDLQTRKDYWANVRTGYTANEEHRHFFTKDIDHPYKESKPFTWVRGYQTGGRSLMWGRQSYRWSDLDFEANAKEGIGIDWPLRYKDLAPWYSYVEKFAGISGQAEGWDSLPDGEFQPAMEMNCAEREIKQRLRGKYPMTIGRVAHLTRPTEEQKELGRTSCQFRNKCMRGCPYGAYFSTQSATLPAAMRTGNLSIVHKQVVFQVIFDDATGKATGVKALHAETGEETEFFARLIFLNASAINTAWIMMQSTSKTHPNGLGNESGQLGRNIMDHHKSKVVSGILEGLEDKYYFGKRPNGIYIPRFVNLGHDKRDFLRGFGYQGGASRSALGGQDLIGEKLKGKYALLGPWQFSLTGFGEILPNENNYFTLSKETDKLGLPLVDFHAELGENEYKMKECMLQEAMNLMDIAGIKNIRAYDSQKSMPGISIHEMGTARMGHSPKNSVLNKHNQVWNAPNVYVTDGAAMVSSSNVNPSLTYMALAARAADHAVQEMKKGNL